MTCWTLIALEISKKVIRYFRRSERSLTHGKGRTKLGVIGCGVIANEMTKLRKEWGLKYPNELW